MKIEILYPEICNLYGDLANIRYLKECLPEAEIIRTSLQEKPAFAREPVDLVYMGTTTEEGQRLALEQLRFIREEIFGRIEEGGNFLVTGNAMELFGDRIEEDGELVDRGLGLFPGVARRSSINRFNSLFLGTFDPRGPKGAAAEKGAGAAGGPADKNGDRTGVGPAGKNSDRTGGGPVTEGAGGEDPARLIRIVGYKSQFGHTWAAAEGTPEGVSDTGLDHLALFTPERGPGMNRYAKGEGIRIRNFMATYLVGPLLILNPPFTAWYIRNQLGVAIDKLAFQEAAMDSYDTRVAEYEDPQTGLYYWGGTTERWT